MPNRGENAPDKRPVFSPATAGIRAAEWTVATDADSETAVIAVDSLDKTFGLEELLYEHRDTPISLVLDPDAFLLSYIKAFSERPECILPDRADMTYSTHCLRSYARHVMDVASRRGAVCDATYRDEPGLFLAGDEAVVADDLLQVPRGRITEQGMRQNIRLVIENVGALLAGEKMPAGNSTVELCRALLWQWMHHETGVLDTGRIITRELFAAWLGEELAAAEDAAATNDARHLQQAADLLANATQAAELAPSLLDQAYPLAE